MYLYSDGRSAISISWSDFPFVSKTLFFTKNTATKQKEAKIEYSITAPSWSSKGKNNRPTKKFITCWRTIKSINKMAPEVQM
jgi:hypothetical protein